MKKDLSEETPGPKHKSPPPYDRGRGPNPNFHDYGKGILKRIEIKEEKE